jgi:hypothetical protein
VPGREGDEEANEGGGPEANALRQKIHGAVRSVRKGEGIVGRAMYDAASYGVARAHRQISPHVGSLPWSRMPRAKILPAA